MCLNFQLIVTFWAKTPVPRQSFAVDLPTAASGAASRLRPEQRQQSLRTMQRSDDKPELLMQE